jgi:hypothetical protein
MLRIEQFHGWFLTLLFISGSFLIAPEARGAAAVQRRLEQQKMQQQQIQYQYQQQMMAQQQAQAMAYQQAMAQRQAVAQQQAYQQAAAQKAAAEYAAYKEAMQMAVAKRQQELQMVEQYKQAMAQKQAIEQAQIQQAVAQKQVAQLVQYKQAEMVKAQVAAKTQAEMNQQVREYSAYLAKRKSITEQQAAMAREVATAQGLVQYNQAQQVAAYKTKMQMKAAAEAEAVRRKAGQTVAGVQALAAVNKMKDAMPEPSGPETTVGLKELWDALDRSSLAWTQIMDQEIKLLTVAEYIDRFTKVGIRIKGTPGKYAGLIDSMTAQMPGLLEAAFMDVLSYVAIVEYDFDNGQNKDDLARKILGDEQFRANKARLEGR